MSRPTPRLQPLPEAEVRLEPLARGACHDAHAFEHATSHEQNSTTHSTDCSFQAQHVTLLALKLTTDGVVARAHPAHRDQDL
jgi:hypothetical protein